MLLAHYVFTVEHSDFTHLAKHVEPPSVKLPTQSLRSAVFSLQKYFNCLLQGLTNANGHRFAPASSLQCTPQNRQAGARL